MGILLNIDDRALQERFADPVLRRVAEEKLRQLRRESLRQFSDDTGELRNTIRIERTNTGIAVAIGDRKREYWQYVRRGRRGDGTKWMRRVFRDGNAQALQRARGAAR